MFARHEIHMENYCKVIRIEAATLIDIVQHTLLSAATTYTSHLCTAIVQKQAPCRRPVPRGKGAGRVGQPAERHAARPGRRS